MSKLKKKIKQTIHQGYSSKEKPDVTLRRVYKIVDEEVEEGEEEEDEYDEEEGYDEEEEYDEGYDEEEGDDEEEDEEEDDEEEGGFFDTILDILPDEDE